MARNDFGPWIGVPRERQTLCAVVDCIAPGMPHRCPWDGQRHHHGCVHYDCQAAQPAVARSGLEFRPGWGLLCSYHYAALVEVP